LVWEIEFVPAAAKELKKLGRAEAARIIATLETRIAVLDDPRTLGSALGGELAGLWRWRIGDYRVVARIENQRITILVVRVAHRREVYRR
jgi:mRNA interferase RelE/StbE